MTIELFYIIITTIYGIIIGSFLNVCIYRVPKKESIVVVPSHCMSCGEHLKWYDLVPLVSFLFLAITPHQWLIYKIKKTEVSGNRA